MKNIIITHFFLNLYILAILHPALPILEYIANYDYISIELCENRDKPVLDCNGKCYLKNQVEEQQNLNHSHRVPMPPKIDLKKLMTINNLQFIYCFSLEQMELIIPLFNNKLKSRVFSSTHYRPPQY